MFIFCAQAATRISSCFHRVVKSYGKIVQTNFRTNLLQILSANDRFFSSNCWRISQFFSCKFIGPSNFFCIQFHEILSHLKEDEWWNTRNFHGTLLPCLKCQSSLKWVWKGWQVWLILYCLRDSLFPPTKRLAVNFNYNGDKQGNAQ